MDENNYANTHSLPNQLRNEMERHTHLSMLRPYHIDDEYRLRGHLHAMYFPILYVPQILDRIQK